jgi:hypothetical protein
VEGRTYRVFFWHINAANKTLTFGLRLHLDAGTAVVGSIRRDVRNEPFTDLSVPGVCLAKAQLLGTLNSVSGTIALSTSSALAWSATVPDTTTAGQLIGCVMEFTVTGLSGGASKLSVRTFCTDSSDQGTFADAVATAPAHVRGWWPRSSMKIKMKPDGRFEFNPAGSPRLVATGVCETDGPEHSVDDGFGLQTGTGHEHDRDNLGAYGVDLVYVCVLKNTSESESGKCFVSLRSRNTGGKYFGAARLVLPVARPGKGVRKLPFGTDQNSLNAILIDEDEVDDCISVPADTSRNLEIRLTNAGAAALPCTLFLSSPGRVAVEDTDPDTE